MGFWIFMSVMDMLIPICMVIFGLQFMKGGPKHVNRAFGYRTTWSMKNDDTWKFAHEFFGKLWFEFGVVLFIASIIVLLFVINKGKDTVGFVGGGLNCLQVVGMIFPILPTEIALRKRFDKNGNRKINDKKIK